MGLIDDRNREYTLDDYREKIGPMGFLSPEAINKTFGDWSRMPQKEQREICEKSDIYQLGMLAFFVLQGEVPVGCIARSDFVEQSGHQEDFLSIIRNMLQFRKSRRPALNNSISVLTEEVR